MKSLLRFVSISIALFLSISTFAQDVGIGTSTPNEKLHVVGKIKADVDGFGLMQTFGTATVASFTNGATGAFGTVSNHPLFFYTNGGAAAMTILNGTDNVGIGTTNPADRLTLQSTSTNVLGLLGPGSYGSQARITFGDANRCYIEEDIDDNLHIYGLSRTAIMGGNVGIGTTAPGSKLEVQDNQLIGPALKVTKNYGTGSNQNVSAIYGENAVDDSYGYGVVGVGGSAGVFGESDEDGVSGLGGLTGVRGVVQSTGSGPYKGILGEAIGSSSNNIGVQGIASNALNGIGVKGEAHSAIAFYNYGIRGEASNASFVNYAVHAAASGDDGLKYGIYSTAWGAGTNYAVYGSAGAGDYNYAGYFTSGNVYVENNLGVGDLPDSYRLRVRHGTYGLKIQYTSSSNFWEFYHAGSGDNAMQLYTNSGYVGGFNYTTGAYTSVSDRRLKENIAPMSSVLSKVMKLQPSSYSFKTDADQRPCLGFIAQDVEEIFPQLVTPPSTDGERETAYTMDYSGFGVLAIKAIQEQQEIIDEQEERIAKLEVLVGELLKKWEQQVQPGQ